MRKHGRYVTIGAITIPVEKASLLWRERYTVLLTALGLFLGLMI